jgi:hypothetical protein
MMLVIFNSVILQEIHNGQKIYPLRKNMEVTEKAPLMTAKMVNKGFVIAFPIAFFLFIGYMFVMVVSYPKGMRDSDGKAV